MGHAPSPGRDQGQRGRAKALGMDAESGVEPPEPALWPILGLLGSGPTMGADAAMVAHDGVAPDSAPAEQRVVSAR
ncbi:type VII secretion protein EccB [Nocardia sp. NPDC051787]|uniref:type VII secretion protein EccB n=1 Tax=Nocardia sp. NPDC051787 TaxID=3155415 RepID=UPI00342B1F6B